eukprot:TRINITY_DN7182_c0_g1_i2.p1 TRINITY_DN7182_c0_g1~~TRINITY_DN7182_c0_g1_i2.p1  ORF type:complete len:700 (+),score=171.60 TRINITY_DN7182_c0_g1_i2:198-2297(+)
MGNEVSAPKSASKKATIVKTAPSPKKKEIEKEVPPTTTPKNGSKKPQTKETPKAVSESPIARIVTSRTKKVLPATPILSSDATVSGTEKPTAALKETPSKTPKTKGSKSSLSKNVPAKAASSIDELPDSPPAAKSTISETPKDMPPPAPIATPSNTTPAPRKAATFSSPFMTMFSEQREKAGVKMATSPPILQTTPTPAKRKKPEDESPSSEPKKRAKKAKHKETPIKHQKNSRPYAQILEEFFAENQQPTTEEIETLMVKTSRSAKQIRRWFTKKRAQLKNGSPLKKSRVVAAEPEVSDDFLRPVEGETPSKDIRTFFSARKAPGAPRSPNKLEVITLKKSADKHGDVEFWEKIEQDARLEPGSQLRLDISCVDQTVAEDLSVHLVAHPPDEIEDEVTTIDSVKLPASVLSKEGVTVVSVDLNMPDRMKNHKGVFRLEVKARCGKRKATFLTGSSVDFSFRQEEAPSAEEKQDSSSPSPTPQKISALSQVPETSEEEMEEKRLKKSAESSNIGSEVDDPMELDKESPLESPREKISDDDEVRVDLDQTDRGTEDEQAEENEEREAAEDRHSPPDKNGKDEDHQSEEAEDSGDQTQSWGDLSQLPRLASEDSEEEREPEASQILDSPSDTPARRVEIVTPRRGEPQNERLPGEDMVYEDDLSLYVSAAPKKVRRANSLENGVSSPKKKSKTNGTSSKKK